MTPAEVRVAATAIARLIVDYPLLALRSRILRLMRHGWGRKVRAKKKRYARRFRDAERERRRAER